MYKEVIAQPGKAKGTFHRGVGSNVESAAQMCAANVRLWRPELELRSADVNYVKTTDVLEQFATLLKLNFREPSAWSVWLLTDNLGTRFLSLQSLVVEREDSQKMFLKTSPEQTAPWKLQQRLWSGCLGENEKFSVGRSWLVGKVSQLCPSWFTSHTVTQGHSDGRGSQTFHLT